MPIVGQTIGTFVTVETSPGSGVFNDLTDYLIRDRLSLKVNSFDFALNNPPAGMAQLGAAVRTTDPTWSGTIASVMTSNPVDWRNGIQFVTVTATNTNSLVANTAPFDLSDVPTVTPPFDYLLEDGSGHYLLENGTDFAPGAYMLEGALSYGYENLSVRTSVNATAGGPPQTQGRASLFQPGLRPGNIFSLTSLNQGYSATPFEVTQVTIIWPAPTKPYYAIEFGDTPDTLAAWTATHAVATPVPVTPPTVVPSGPVIYGNATTGHVLYAAGGGIVTIATATFTVNALAGHTLTAQVLGQIDCRAYGWDDYVAVPRRAVRAILSGGIYTGAWQETPGGTSNTAGARAIYNLSSAPGLALAAGTYTVSLQIDTVEFNQMEVFSGWIQVAVTTI